VSILDAPDERRDDFVAPYFRHTKNDAVVVILKAREPAPNPTWLLLYSARSLCLSQT
jgi:hypothetical protein